MKVLFLLGEYPERQNKQDTVQGLLHQNLSKGIGVYESCAETVGRRDSTTGIVFFASYGVSVEE